jgi:hypothetical protein
MLDLWVLRLVDKDNPDDVSSVQQISRPEFRWFITEEFRRLREGGSQVVSLKTDEVVKEKILLSSEDFLSPDRLALPDKGVTFWKIYNELENEQNGSSNQIDKILLVARN